MSGGRCWDRIGSTLLPNLFIPRLAGIFSHSASYKMLGYLSFRRINLNGASIIPSSIQSQYASSIILYCPIAQCVLLFSLWWFQFKKKTEHSEYWTILVQLEFQRNDFEIHICIHFALGPSSKVASLSNPRRLGRDFIHHRSIIALEGLRTTLSVHRWAPISLFYGLDMLEWNSISESSLKLILHHSLGSLCTYQ